MKRNETATLFSGGTDSTLTAALMADKFDKIHLITYDRFAFSSVMNPMVNVQKLRDKYGEDKFDFHVIKVEKLTRFVFYERYAHNIRKHGFFLLTICGLCKLAMHVRTVIFCLENGIPNVSDGANQGMHLFPAQMANVIKEYGDMYTRFGITYSNPVFKYEGPQDLDFTDRLRLERVLSRDKEPTGGTTTKEANTTGRKLYELGLMPSENVKGSELDRKMQPRCFQFILFNVFVHWLYLADHTYDEYQDATVRFYRDKIAAMTAQLDDYVNNGAKSRLSKIIER
ncbi:MAG: hypothetical protein K8I00_01825 [Candidatus Omnitrophica bacterium]|nr:hypothetical protein [Candidatus Omnitrophota bacterium]